MGKTTKRRRRPNNNYITISKIVVNFDLSLNYFDLSATFLLLLVHFGLIFSVLWKNYSKTFWKKLSFYGIQKVEVKLIFETSSIGIFTGTYMISLSSFIIIAQSLQLLSNWIWSEIITNSVPHVTQIILPIFQFKRHVWSENRSSLISYKHLKITIV